MLGIDFIDKAITFRAFNPYKAKYPNIKVIPRTALHVMKELQSEGHKVKVLPDDDRELKYIVHKGPWDILNDPFVISAADHLIDIIKSVLAAHLYYEFKKGRSSNPKENSSDVIIQTKKDGEIQRFDHNGKKISAEDWRTRESIYKEIEKVYSNLVKKGSPYKNYPWPVFLEHTPKHIGWALAEEDEIGPKMETKIFDEDVLKRIESNELRGGSFTGIVNNSKCSICSSDYTKCNHITGNKYEGKSCVNNIFEIDLCCLNIVSEPVNPKAKINFKVNPAS